LQITEEVSDDYKKLDTEMLVAPAPAPAAINGNIQAVMLKNIVPDLEWFDGDQTKFKDWWRGI